MPIMLIVDGEILTENVAMHLWISRAFPDAGLLPSEPWEQAQAVSILAWCASGIHPFLSRINLPVKVCDMDETSDSVVRLASETLNECFAIANDLLSRQRIPYSAGCIGVAVKAHELALEYAGVRETFGAALSSRQAIQWMLVDNEIDIQQARWATLEAASHVDRGEPFRKQAAMAKLIASEGASRVVDRCIQIHGGYGVTKDFPFERWYREMRIRRIGEGPSEVQRHIIARDILGQSLR